MRLRESVATTMYGFESRPLAGRPERMAHQQSQRQTTAEQSDHCVQCESLAWLPCLLLFSSVMQTWEEPERSQQGHVCALSQDFADARLMLLHFCPLIYHKSLQKGTSQESKTVTISMGMCNINRTCLAILLFSSKRLDHNILIVSGKSQICLYMVDPDPDMLVHGSSPHNESSQRANYPAHVLQDFARCFPEAWHLQSSWCSCEHGTLL